MLGSANETAIPAESVTKVMTALVVLDDHPITSGQSGPTVTLTDADVQSYQADVSDKQSTVRVLAGEQLTELQLLEGMLIPSANNYAETVARWDAGSIAGFVGKMNDLAKVVRMTHTRFGDVSGASEASVSTPSDLVRLGMQAMQNAVFASIVAMPQAQLPVAGTVYNVDAVLGQSGIVGIKTGSGLSTGANFLFASSLTVDGHTIAIYGCVMGQPTLEDAFSSAKSLISATSPALHVRQVITRNQTVGNYTTPWGASSDVVSAVDVDLVEWPGMIVRQTIGTKSLVVDHPISPGTAVGTDHVVLGDYSLDVPLVTADQMYPPGRFWRFTRISL
jgi:D-alanyl-D-alanine carboxypeptidase (penicillin-binding protein 5/6)